ncbi:hypothetical protein E2562_034115 [Oryza meyeriana var. granulata]|uniref:Uncharacterized protein n=1 Tax=Oryza meyeriana var. granulata TaxID=110450 RepID=A0A6G1E6T1_9ORYZ|nr:hypothetical protein E2562_034115 [Oryza meyeriana var. granulata]
MTISQLKTPRCPNVRCPIKSAAENKLDCNITSTCFGLRCAQPGGMAHESGLWNVVILDYFVH